MISPKGCDIISLNREIPVCQEPMIFCRDCAQLQTEGYPKPFCSWLSAFLEKPLLEQPWICEGFSKNRAKKKRTR